MHLFYRKEELDKANAQAVMPEPDVERPLWQNALYFAAMVGILVFANWGKPTGTTGLWYAVYSVKWVLTGVFAAVLFFILVAWFRKSELGRWCGTSWDFAQQILPLLFVGVIIAGFFLGRPGHEGFIPSAWVERAVGGNSLRANFFASVAGAFMYFATLTEVPILQGLMGAGMGKGPALALLLAGPALSLPNMLVIRSVMGTQKTVVFVSLVIIMATISGIIFGTFWG
jgi:uncharacterized membrane protein YraQ (UPF0718 family)